MLYNQMTHDLSCKQLVYTFLLAGKRYFSDVILKQSLFRQSDRPQSWQDTAWTLHPRWHKSEKAFIYPAVYAKGTHLSYLLQSSMMVFGKDREGTNGGVGN